MIGTLVASIRQNELLQEWWDSNANYLARDFRAYVSNELEHREEYDWRPYRFSGLAVSE